jgi:hypothetical protein
MCRNWKLWAILGGVAVAIAVIAPGARATVLPLLFVATCPLSMVVMGIGMSRASRRPADRTVTARHPERAAR